MGSFSLGLNILNFYLSLPSETSLLLIYKTGLKKKKTGYLYKTSQQYQTTSDEDY